MAAERKTGLGSLPAGLLRPTTPPPEPEASAEPLPVPGPDDAGDAAAEGQGRGAAPEARASRVRTRRPPVSTETKGRKLHLPDDVHDRLWLLARQKRKSVSAVAAEILDRNLPRFTVQREG
jgi:hypothetical protein